MESAEQQSFWSGGESFSGIQVVELAYAKDLERHNKELLDALANLLRAADNSNCDSTACMKARAVIEKAKG